MTPAITSPRRTAVVGAVAVVALWLGLAAPTTSPVAGAATSGDPVAALDWLAGELAAGGHRLEGVGRTDWGLTADAALAAVAGGRATDPDVAATVDQLLAHLDEYSTWDDLGPDFAGVRLAGPAAKTLLVALLAGRTGPDVDELEATVRSLVSPSGPDAGRLVDRNPHGPDASDSFDQAYGVLALARTAGGAPDAAVRFLLDQQCPAGGFRLGEQPSGGCTTDAVIDTDASAVVVEALLAVPRTPDVAAALGRAVAWMLSVQDPATGSFRGTGPTDTPNANSTALFAQVLRGAGRTAEADAASAWVAALQLTPATAGAAAADAGAIAYDPAALDAAVAGGVGTLARDQWRRSTSQAVLAFGLPVLGSVGEAPPEPIGELPPVPTTTTTPGTSTSTTSTTAATSTSTTTSSLATTTTTDPVQVLGATSRRVTSSVAATTSTARAASPLARTGTDVAPVVALALALVAAGALLVTAVRPRRAP
jgi:hypothetical protein